MRVMERLAVILVRVLWSEAANSSGQNPRQTVVRKRSFIVLLSTTRPCSYSEPGQGALSLSAPRSLAQLLAYTRRRSRSSPEGRRRRHCAGLLTLGPLKEPPV